MMRPRGPLPVLAPPPHDPPLIKSPPPRDVPYRSSSRHYSPRSRHPTHQQEGHLRLLFKCIKMSKSYNKLITAVAVTICLHLIVVTVIPFKSPFPNLTHSRKPTKRLFEKQSSPSSGITSNVTNTARKLTRFDKPFYRYPDLHPDSQHLLNNLNRIESNNRVLLSSVANDVGDGLGHRLMIMAAERLLAHKLNAIYSHRVSLYGSLTKGVGNEKAVERFFGWGDNWDLTRDDVLERDCEKVRKVKDDCHAERIGCEKLKESSSLKTVVKVEWDVMLCFIGKTVNGTSDAKKEKNLECERILKSFEEKYRDTKNVLFELEGKNCYWKFATSNFEIVRRWFVERFWERRKVDVKERSLDWDEKEVHIGMHIRRGDFFMKRYSHRLMVPDATYIHVLRRMMEKIDEQSLRSSRSSSPRRRYRVHVYSQGKSRSEKEGEFIDHDVSKARHKYVSEDGAEKPDGYWLDLLVNGSRALESLRNRVKFDLQISTDTLKSIDGMVSSDVFIGGTSGLSYHVVRMYSRGLMLMITDSKYENPSDKFVQNIDVTGQGVFTKKKGTTEGDAYFDADKFARGWDEYSKNMIKDIDNV
eukprot:Plantae.Rhodophyta-Hildenbrandia_rubra.ctg13418.p1 GENE.Plantae.Rhodophyta-Hildenbrandia_rubra.ctg13418~~Plantae.Rhodophyta-Hildenbrandia_rubra.ctg13418.p1  ORF type:complete len:585 (+),score=81.32 Plantae.Rhodophyta-Hildenbrandia_rubra.ctg13418:1782-3536(+)